MYIYKKGFTLVEVILVAVLIIAIFSMSLAILGSFSNSNQKYIEKDFDKVRSIMGQVKYLRFLSEKNINVVCANRRITLSVDNQIIDEKQLSFLTCDQDLKLYSASSTYEVKINQYGYVSFQRI